MPVVLVPAERVERWVENFRGRHGRTRLAVTGGALTGASEDGSSFAATLPLGVPYDDLSDAAAFATAVTAAAPADWGVLLVRKGGFAVARLHGEQVVASKVGQRHVQGRTKAGGQSQQRFARRRANQARAAYEAAADHAARLLGDLGELGHLGGPLATGGDRQAVEEVLADARLAGVARAGAWLALPDPRRSILEQGVRDALSAVVEVHNA